VGHVGLARTDPAAAAQLLVICKYGNPGCSVREIMTWPLSEVREAADDVSYLLIQEQKNAKAT
jgi:hypothetical protein